VSRHFSTILLLLAVFWAPPQALADPVETFGFSWSGRGTAGNCTAGVSAVAAAWYNPALVARGSTSVLLGASWGHSELTPAAASPPDTSFLELGAALPIIDVEPVPPVWLGITAMTPPTSLYDIDLPDDEDAQFLLLDSRERRLSLSAALATSLFNVFYLGVGVEMLPTVDGAVQADLANPLGTNELQVDVGYRLSPTMGLVIDFFEFFRLGLSYRGQSKTRIHIPVDVTADGLQLSASVLARTYFVPARFSTGLELYLTDGFLVETDVTWSRYSSFVHPSPSVTVSAQGIGSETTIPGLKDIVSPGASVKYSDPYWQLYDLALGYRYSPSPTPAQTGRNNLLATNSHTLALGARVRLYSAGITPNALYLTGDFSWSRLTQRVDYKEEILAGNPGYPSIAYGGYRVSGGIGLEMEY
jgi:hypothetical protein